MGSLAVYYITGPYQKTIYMRHYKYGEELEKVQQSSSVLHRAALHTQLRPGLPASDQLQQG